MHQAGRATFRSGDPTPSASVAAPPIRPRQPARSARREPSRRQASATPASARPAASRGPVSAGAPRHSGCSARSGRLRSATFNSRNPGLAGFQRQRGGQRSQCRAAASGQPACQAVITRPADQKRPRPGSAGSHDDWLRRRWAGRTRRRSSQPETGWPAWRAARAARRLPGAGRTSPARHAVPGRPPRRAAATAAARSPGRQPARCSRAVASASRLSSRRRRRTWVQAATARRAVARAAVAPSANTGTIGRAAAWRAAAFGQAAHQRGAHHRPFAADGRWRGQSSASAGRRGGRWRVRSSVICEAVRPKSRRGATPAAPVPGGRPQLRQRLRARGGQRRGWSSNSNMGEKRQAS